MARKYKGVHTFPKGISSKANVIAQQEIELAYYDIAVQWVSPYTTGTPPTLRLKRKNKSFHTTLFSQ